MVLDANDALTQLVIFAGVVLGNMGATLIPYIKAQAKYQEFDISILFQKKFLGTAAGAGITAFIMVSGSFNAFLGQVLSGNPLTYLAAFLAALGLGFTINTGINWILPSPTNPQASKQLEEARAARVLESKGIDASRLNEITRKD